MNRRIQQSSRKDRTGSLFSVTLNNAGLDWFGDFKRPRGLYIGKSGTGAAKLRLTVGNQDGGAEETREFTLINSGVWLSAIWWSVSVEIVEIADNCEVFYSWTPEQPPDISNLFLIETISSGTGEIPKGAKTIRAENADAGWSWTTNQNGTPQTFSLALSAGVQVAVLGDSYTATGANLLVWELSAL